MRCRIAVLIQESPAGSLNQHRDLQLLRDFVAGHKGMRKDVLQCISLGGVDYQHLGDEVFSVMGDIDFLVEGVLALLDTFVCFLDI